MQSKHLSKSIHLIVSALLVVPIAFVYGFYPDSLFDISVNSIDEANVFKAIMGLYLAFAFFWVLGVVNNAYWKAASISNVLFMLGLAFGRIISLVYDGMPSQLFVFGTIGEIVLAIYSFLQLLNERKTTKANNINA